MNSDFAEITENLKIGEICTIREVEENTYIKRRKDMQLLSSKKKSAVLINRDHHRSQE